MHRLSEIIEELQPMAVLPPENGVGGGRSDPAAILIERVTADSRLVQPGSLFVAVRGLRVDGHRFLGEAVRRGAAAAVVEAPGGVGAAADLWRIVVGDCRRALGRIAALLAGRPANSLTLVGITGTNGKTTTAFLVRSILQAAGRRTGLIGTISYETGSHSLPAPLTTPDAVRLQGLLADMVRAGMDSAVLEVSSHALDQHRTEGISFDVGVFTNLSRDHGDYHRTRRSYARAKRRLFESLDSTAAAVLNRRDPVSMDFARHTAARLVWYGPGGEVEAQVHQTDLQGSRLTLKLPGDEVEVKIHLVGRHNVENATAAAAVGVALGFEPKAIKLGLEALKAVPGRLEPVRAGQPFHILVDYAHTDDALGKVLRSLRPLVGGRLILIFGAGGNRDRAKRPRMGRVAARWADLVFLTSDNPRNEDPGAIIGEVFAGVPARARGRVVREPDRRSAIHAAVAQAKPGDLVLIAGKGHERTQKFANNLEIPFDDREVARSAVEGLRRPRAAVG